MSGRGPPQRVCRSGSPDWFATGPEGTVNPKLATGEVEVEAHGLELLNTAKTPPFYVNEEVGRRRESSPPVPLCRPPSRPAAAERALAPPRRQAHAGLPGRARLYRSRDTAPDQEHSGRRARLPGAEQRFPRDVLRAPAISSATEAAPDDRRLRPLLPDRPLLPRRTAASRPPAGVHPARRRNVVRRSRGRHVADRGALHRVDPDATRTSAFSSPRSPA